MESTTKRYTNGEITVIWDSSKCWHAAECVSNLPDVFRPTKHPWVNLHAASSQEIATIIDLCPSGALTYELGIEN